MKHSIFHNKAQSVELAVLLSLALFGFFLSSMALNHHLDVRINGVTQAICNVSETFSCDALSRTAYATPLGVPMAFWGMAYFALLALQILLVMIAKRHRHLILQIEFLTMGGGLAWTVWAAAASLLLVGIVCLTCIVVYLTQMALAATNVRMMMREKSSWRAFFSPASLLGAVGFGLVFLALLSLYKAKSKDIEQTYYEYTMNAPYPQINWRRALSQEAKFNVPIQYDGPAEGRDRILGHPAAPVTMVVFVDYQCPICADLLPVLQELLNQLSPILKIVIKNYPLSQRCNPQLDRDYHEYACELAYLAQCLPDEDAYLAFAEFVYLRPSFTVLTDTRTWLQRRPVGADVIKCAASSTVHAKVSEDVATGASFQFSGTPQIVVNGYHYRGERRFSSLKQLVINMSEQNPFGD